MEIQIFKNVEFGSVRTHTDENGKTTFCGKDVAQALGYANTKKAISDHCKEDGVTFRYLIDNLGRQQEVKFISEGNLYRLITHSKLPTAEKFESWVFDEVLPSIRKTGSYGELNLEELIAKTAVAVVNEIMKQNLIQSAKPAEPEEPYIRKPSLASSIIGRLDTELQLEIDDMILSNRYTYAGIKQYLKENYGISISASSIQRRKEFLYGQSKRKGNSL